MVTVVVLGFPIIAPLVTPAITVLNVITFPSIILLVPKLYMAQPSLVPGGILMTAISPCIRVDGTDGGGDGGGYECLIVVYKWYCYTKLNSFSPVSETPCLSNVTSTGIMLNRERTAHT